MSIKYNIICDKISFRFRRLKENIFRLFYLKMISKRFYIRFINLDRRPDRRKYIENLLDNYYLEYKRIPATEYQQNGENDDTSKLILKRCIIKYLLEEEYQKDRVKGVVGAYISHVRSIMDIDPADHRLQFIFEDDIVIKSIGFFTSILKNLPKLPSDWDILMVDCEGTLNENDKIGENLYFPRDTWPVYHGGHAILINSAKKDKILETFANCPVRDYDGLLTKNNTGVITYMLKTGYAHNHAGMYGSDITPSGHK